MTFENLIKSYLTIYLTLVKVNGQLLGIMDKISQIQNE